jgi:LuxR family maltose regulon positive regulatory protein
MDTLILTTKLHVPPLHPSLAPRPRLIQRLDEGLRLGRKLTLISAPAGFGKSTLLSEWLLGRSGAGRGGVTPPLRAAWLSLDEGDNDLTRFLAYLIAALRTIEPDLGETVLGALQSSQPPVIEPVLITLINEIAALPGRCVLILDDYHLIEAQPIHDAVAFMLDNLPPGMHWVIASRKDPLLPLARLRGRRQLTELRAADLRFTPAETAVLLNQVMDLKLSAEDVDALEKQTEGWITGLQFAALSLQGRADATEFIQAFSGSHQYVLDYLVEEVLQQQREEIQAFLRQTSILERLTGPLCDAVMGISESTNPTGRLRTQRITPAAIRTLADSQSLLEHLERANLFIVPLDSERRWYRYHHLFADLLRVRLRQTAAPASGGVEGESEQTLHRRACAWFETEGLTAEAIHHALAAGDHEHAAQLVEQDAWAMLSGGETMTLLRWVNALPDHTVRSRPWLCVYHALALLLGSQLDAVEPRLADAEREVHDSGWPADELRSLTGHVAAVRAYAASYRGQATQTIEYARQALESLPEDNLAIRSLGAFALGAASYLRNDATAAAEAFAQAGAMARASGNIHLAVPAISAVAGLQALFGQPHQAAETYQEALDLALASHRTTPLAARAYSGLSAVHYEWHDLAAATRCAREAIRLGRLWGSVDVLAVGHAVLARSLQAQGNLDAAQEALQEAEQLARKHHLTPGVPEVVAAGRARLWLARGDLSSAVRWAAERRSALRDEVTLLSEVEQIAVARACSSRRGSGRMRRGCWRDCGMRPKPEAAGEGWSRCWRCRPSPWDRKVRAFRRPRRCRARFPWPRRRATSAPSWMRARRWRRCCAPRLRAARRWSTCGSCLRHSATKRRPSLNDRHRGRHPPWSNP